MRDSSGNAAPGAKKILIVDDEPSVSDYLKALITSWGYEAACFDCGAGAFEKIQSEKPDLVLMDVMLPDLDGVTICKRLRSHPETRTLPVIMITSLTDSATVQDSLVYGASDYVAKPVNEKVLREKIEKILR